MTKQTETKNYTEAQEQLIREAAPLNLAKATQLANDVRMNAADGSPRKPRSIVAKALSMKVPYERKQPVTKTGEKPVKKEELVAAIAKAVEGNLDGLEKAPKAALVALRDALAA